MSDPNTDTISTPSTTTTSLSSSPYLSASSGSGESVESAESIPPPATPPNLHQNTVDPSAGWVIQKFGGTSVGKYARRIGEEVVKNYIDSNKVAIVCSARSGSTKALGTTNLLLQAASQALNHRRGSKSRSNSASGSATPNGIFSPNPAHSRDNSQTPPMTPSVRDKSGIFNWPSDLQPLSTLTGNSPSKEKVVPVDSGPSFNKTVDLIKEEHVKHAKECVRDEGILGELVEEIERECEWLRNFLFASQVIDEISPRSKDTIIGVGERLSCKLMTAVLRDLGIDAEYVDLEHVVPEYDHDTHATGGGSGGMLNQEFYEDVARAIEERISECGRRVPVVTGFFGPVPGSLLSQIGRGYTDLCAALLAVGVQANELQIWKEVDGIFTADPRKVSTARVIPIISPEEAAELTYYGSEVIHPFTMEQVIRKKIPIRIKNVENPEGAGTIIFPDPDPLEEGEEPNLLTNLGPLNGPDSPLSATAPRFPPLSGYGSGTSSPVPYPSKRLPTAVTIKEKIMVINVNSNRKSVSHGFLAGIFGTLDRFGVVVDLISTSEVHVSMAIEDGYGGGGEGMGKRILERLVGELKKCGTVSVHRNMAILSLVGKHMRHMVGISGKMFTALAQGNVNIEMISQGASEINISCVIDGKDAVKALNMIHQSCLHIPPLGRMGPWLF